MSSGGFRRACACARDTDDRVEHRTCNAWSPRRPWAIPNSTRCRLNVVTLRALPRRT